MNLVNLWTNLGKWANKKNHSAVFITGGNSSNKGCFGEKKQIYSGNLEILPGIEKHEKFFQEIWDTFGTLSKYLFRPIKLRFDGPRAIPTQLIERTGEGRGGGGWLNLLQELLRLTCGRFLWEPNFLSYVFTCAFRLDVISVIRFRTSTVY